MMSFNRRLIIAAALLGGTALATRRALRRLRRCNFRGKNVFITGGSRGLGLVMARQLAKAGARIAICARDTDELAAAAEQLRYFGGVVLALPCDLRKPGEIQAAVHQVEQHLGPIEVLINNAGIIRVGPMEEMTQADYAEALDVHFWAPLHAINAVLPHMRRRRSGRIVNISSIGGRISVPHLLPYSASKFALVGLSEGLRAELLSSGIYVTTVCPGLMRTGSADHAEFKGQHSAEFTWFSIGASTPVISVSAENAAKQILDACRHGNSQVVIGLPAKAAALAHGIAPGLVADAFALVNQLLPGPGGIGSQRATGLQSRPAWLPAWLTKGNDRAAAQNNQMSVRQFIPRLQRSNR